MRTPQCCLHLQLHPWPSLQQLLLPVVTAGVWVSQHPNCVAGVGIRPLGCLKGWQVAAQALFRSHHAQKPLALPPVGDVPAAAAYWTAAVLLVPPQLLLPAAQHQLLQL